MSDRNDTPFQPGDPLPSAAQCRYCGAEIAFFRTRNGSLPFDLAPSDRGTFAYHTKGVWEEMVYVRVIDRHEASGKLYTQHKCKQRDAMVSTRGEVAWLRRCVADPAFFEEDVPQEWKDAVTEVIEVVRAMRSRMEGASDVRDGG